MLLLFALADEQYKLAANGRLAPQMGRGGDKPQASNLTPQASNLTPQASKLTVEAGKDGKRRERRLRDRERDKVGIKITIKIGDYSWPRNLTTAWVRDWTCSFSYTVCRWARTVLNVMPS